MKFLHVPACTPYLPGLVLTHLMNMRSAVSIDGDPAALLSLAVWWGHYTHKRYVLEVPDIIYVLAVIPLLPFQCHLYLFSDGFIALRGVQG